MNVYGYVYVYVRRMYIDMCMYMYMECTHMGMCIYVCRDVSIGAYGDACVGVHGVYVDMSRELVELRIYEL